MPPSLRDPRLHVAAVLVTLQVLGQTVLDFDLSVAQILAAVGTCAALEIAITARRHGVLAWPASALLTGNGVAFILRVPGTRHGDWWSTRGIGIFAATAGLGLLSKYVIRYRGEHLFNPSNIGLVVCFLALGVSRADPQDLWWGSASWGLAVTFAVIVVGGLTLAARVRMLGVAAAFWVTFAAGTGILALSGHCMTARWRVGPVCGASFWWVLITSPEVLVFLFFMITDPKTAPRGQVGRLLYSTLVGFFAVVLVAPQRTEFATKVAILGALVLVTAARPLIERWSPAPGASDDIVGRWLRRLVTRGPGPVGATPTGERRPRWAVLRLMAGLAVVPLGGAAIVLAGAAAPDAPSPPPSSVAAGTPTRPVLPPDPARRPPLTISPEVSEVAPSFSPDDARRMADDAVDDLVIAADAIHRHQPDLAATALTGAELERVHALMAEHRGRGEAVGLTYTFEAVHVLVVRVGPQASPEIAVAVRGRVATTVAGGSPSTVLSLDEAPLARTLSLVPVGGHHLIADDLTPR